MVAEKRIGTEYYNLWILFLRRMGIGHRESIGMVKAPPVPPLRMRTSWRAPPERKGHQLLEITTHGNEGEGRISVPRKEQQRPETARKETDATQSTSVAEGVSVARHSYARKLAMRSLPAWRRDP